LSIDDCNDQVTGDGDEEEKKITIIIIVSEHSKNWDKNLIGTIVASRSRIAKTQSEI